jgi:hypothetical protein
VKAQVGRFTLWRSCRTHARIIKPNAREPERMLRASDEWRCWGPLGKA